MRNRDVLDRVHTPFQIGALTLPHRLIQAPLAGISCAPFRALFAAYTKPAYAVTEMVSAHSILQHQRLHKRYLSHSSQEGLWCIQLSGNDATLMHQATEIAACYQPDLIDLNCGCPKPKIRAKGCGSALMSDSSQLQAVVSAMRRATSLPLTVKIRVAGHTNDETYLEAATIIEACGADAIIVHGRHYSENYDVAANYEQIKRVVNRVKIPVIVNGDVCDALSMQQSLDESGATAVMVGRASIGKPWLFYQLLGSEIIPTATEVLDLFQTHINQLAVLEASEQVALLQARRFLKWYFPDLNGNQLTLCYKIQNLKLLYDTLASNYD
ncbi:MAG: tRNA-dihydrouridine synthase [Legionellaceae bacterium]|nr:tRNA-dihydrouridine synthase [Legionellaceae bacterium]